MLGIKHVHIEIGYRIFMSLSIRRLTERDQTIGNFPIYPSVGLYVHYSTNGQNRNNNNNNNI